MEEEMDFLYGSPFNPNVPEDFDWIDWYPIGKGEYPFQASVIITI
jgi:hypothetical protein